MAQALFDALAAGVTMDQQTALAVQSLLDSQQVTETTQVDEDDVFQCGKCKKQFTSLASFVSHKQVRCTPLGQTNLRPPAQPPGSNPNSAFTTSVPHAIQRQQVTYQPVPQSPIQQIGPGMVLTDDLMAFNIDQGIQTSTLQVGGATCTIQGNPFLSQVAPLTPRSSATTSVFGTVNTSGVFSGNTSAFTSTLAGNQVQTIQIQPLQQATHLTQVAQPQVVSSVSNTQEIRTATVTISKPENTRENSIQQPGSVVKQRRTKTGTGNTAALEEASPKKKLKCQYCEKMFAKNFDLQQHVRSHTGEKPFQCIVCGRAFAQKSNVKKHMQTHKVWPSGANGTLPKQPPPLAQTITVFEGGVDNEQTPEAAAQEVVVESESNGQAVPSGVESPSESERVEIVIDSSYLCQYCPEKFKTYFLLKSHMMQHKTEQVYKCVLKSCGETFKELDTFLEHTKTHEEQMSYRCHMCQKQFPSLYELGVHQYSHSLYPNQGPKSGNREFKCTKCSNKYTSPEALQHHLQTTSHKYVCEYCSKVFTCERYLRRHLQIHGTTGEYVCEVCNKKFKTEHYLKSHAMIHSGEKPFVCDLCSAAFNRKDKLKRHMLIHDNNKRFKCPFRSHTGCMMAFNRPDKLKAHIITHSGIKPFKCNQCGKEFSRKPHLREHERGHRGEYRYRCEVCNKGFAREKFLRSHKCKPPKEGETAQKDKFKSRKTTRAKQKMITVTAESLKPTRKLPGRASRRKRTIIICDGHDSPVEVHSEDIHEEDESNTQTTEISTESQEVANDMMALNNTEGQGSEVSLLQQRSEVTDSGIIALNHSDQNIANIGTIQNVQIIQDGDGLQIVVGHPQISENGSTILVATSGTVDQQQYTTTDGVPIQEYTTEDGDPVLQGTENMLRESAEILKAADQS